MSAYVKATNFYIKDSLLTGNPSKIIKGAEIDDEYNALAIAVNSKADLTSPTFLGTPLAPTATAGTNTTQIATTAFVITNGVPSGGILMWSGSVVSIPSGFNLCDGTNGTPDLRNRFIVGAGSTYAPNAVGGSNNASVISHTHTATSIVTDPSHIHTSYGAALNASGDPQGGDPTGVGSSYYNTTAAVTGITVATTNASTGVSGTNANMPAYLALAYIMKL